MNDPKHNSLDDILDQMIGECAGHQAAPVQHRAEGGKAPDESALFNTLFPAIQFAQPQSAASQVPDHAQHVAAAVQAHGGEYNLAPLHKIREHLASVGLTERAAQDAAIAQARKAGMVSGSGLEGRHGIDPAHLAASIPEDQGRIGFLSRLDHLATGGLAPGQEGPPAPEKPGFLTRALQLAPALKKVMQERYGKAGAAAILGTGQAIGWGTTAATAAMGMPLVIPGMSLLGALPGVAIAEAVRYLRRPKKGAEQGKVPGKAEGGDVPERQPHEIARPAFIQQILDAELKNRKEAYGVEGFADTEDVAEQQVTALPGSATAKNFIGRESVEGIHRAGDKTLVSLKGTNVAGYGSKGKEHIRRILALAGIHDADDETISNALAEGKIPGNLVGGYIAGMAGKVGTVYVAPEHRGKAGGLSLLMSDMKRRGMALDRSSPHSKGMLAAVAKWEHREAVQKALAAGEKVPPEVLADYPELTEQYKPPTLALGGPPLVGDQPAFTPQGTDTQPAKIPAGSYVVNRASAEANAPLLDQLGASTVPDQPGAIADFTGKDAGSPAELTPGEKVVPPSVMASKPGLAQQINAAHGAVKQDWRTPMPRFAVGGGVGHFAGGGPFGAGPSPFAPGAANPPPPAAPAGPFGYGGGAAPLAAARSSASSSAPIRVIAALPLPVVLSGGLANVRIIGPVPLPVSGRGGGGSGGAGGDGGAGGTGGPAFDPLANLGKGFKGLIGSFKEIGTAFASVSGKLTSAVAVATAGMTGLVAAASPVAFSTLSGSIQLLAGNLGGMLLPAAAKVSITLQQMSWWIRSLSQETTSGIARWGMYAGGGLLAATVLGKVASIAGGLLPILTGLRTAMVFTVTNPFGMVLAGLGALAAFKPEVFAGIGKAISDAFQGVDLSSLFATLTQGATAFANVAAGLLGPALNAVAGAIKIISGALSGLGGLFGMTSSQTFQLVAATALLYGPIRMLITGGWALVSALDAGMSRLAAYRAGLIGVGTAFGVGTAGATAFKAALISTGIGALAVGIGVAVSALMQMSGAFGAVGSQVEQANSKILQLKATLDRLQQGGKPNISSVNEVLNDEQRKAYNQAKTKEERDAVLKKALATAEERKKTLGFGNVRKEQIEYVGMGVQGALGEEAPTPTRATRKSAAKWATENLGESLDLGEGLFTDRMARIQWRQRKIRMALSDAGINEEVSSTVTTDLLKNRAARDLLGQKKLSEEDIQKVVGNVQHPLLKDFSRIEILKNALSGGIEGGGEKSTLEKLREVQRFRSSFSRDNVAQVTNLGDVRQQVQNANLNTDPLQRLIDEQGRERNKQFDKFWAKFEKAEINLDELLKRIQKLV